MKKGIFGTPIVASAILLMVFAAAFAAYNTTRQGGSSAASIGCSVGTDPVKLFFQDNPAYSVRGKRVLFSTDNAVNTREFTLPNDSFITPGKYEVRTISSDSHYTHRSSGPNEDVQKQYDEQYYIEIDGQRTPQKSSDFTDFYDWRGGDGELIQDDDNEIDSIPAVIRDTWNGEYIGTIDVANLTNKVTAHHSLNFDDKTPGSWSPDSVIPSAVILTCINPGSPSLEIMKEVDGNGDNQFDPTLEKTQQGDTVTWKVTGKNVGDADDPNAKMHTCAPVGTTLVAGSATITNGGGTITETAENCIEWSGPIAEAGNVSFIFKTVITDFAVCDKKDTQDDKCTCDAVIYSAATETTEANPADSDTAAVEIAMPEVSIEKTVDGNSDSTFSDLEQIEVGSEFKWKIVASNTGAYDAKIVQIIDNAPAGLEFVKATVSLDEAATVDMTDDASLVSSGELVWNGSIKAGGSATIELTAMIVSTVDFVTCDNVIQQGGEGTCSNSTEVWIDNGGGLEKADEDSAEVTIPAPTLTIDKTVEGVDSDTTFTDSEEVEKSKSFVWRVVVTNTGTVDAANYRISDDASVSEGYKYTEVSQVSASTGVIVLRDSMKVSDDGLSVNVDVDIPAGGNIVLDITAEFEINEAYDACAALTAGSSSCVNVVNLFELDSDNDPVDSDPGTDGVQPIGSDDAEVVLKKDPIVSIEKTVDGNDDGQYAEKEEIVTGREFTWKVVASNAANAGVAKDVIIRDVLPAGVKYAAAASPSDNTVVVLNKSVTTSDFSNDLGHTWIGTIQPGGTVTITYTTIISDVDAFLACDNDPYTGNVAGDRVCHNEAVIGFTETPNDPENAEVNPVDSDGADVTTVLNTELSIIKQVDGSDDDNDQPGRFSDNDVEEILLGTEFTWKINASNTGDEDVANARVRDEIPAGVTLDESKITYSVNGVDNVGSLVVIDEGNGVIVWTGELKRNDSVEITFVTRVSDYDAYKECLVESGSDSCRNVAAVGTTDNPSDPKDFDEKAQDPAYVNIIREPKLQIEKTVDGDVDDDANGREFTKREAIHADGTTVRWRIVGCNVGTADEINAAIFPWSAVDGLSDEINYVAGSATVTIGDTLGELTEENGGFSWHGELIAGAVDEPGVCVTIEYDTTVEDVATFQKCNVADGSGDDDSCTLNAQIGVQEKNTADQFVVADTDDAQIYKEPKGILTLSKTVDGNRDGQFSEIEDIEFGVEYDYKVVVTNEGDATIENAAMRDALPQGVVSTGEAILSPADFGVVSISPGDHTLVFWTVDKFEPGESVSIIFPVKIGNQAGFDACDSGPVDGSQDDVCTNTAAAGTGTDDSDFNPITEPDPAKVVVKLTPEVYIDKTVDGTDSDQDFTKLEKITTDSSEFTYKVVFGNRGTAEAKAVKVVTGVMPGLIYVSHEIDTEDGTLTYDDQTQMIMWEGGIAPGDEHEITFVVKTASREEYAKCDTADGSDDNRCACVAVVTSGDQTERSTAVVDVDDVVEEKIDVDKLVDGDGDGIFSELEEIVVGEEITWRVVAKNNTTVDIADVIVTDTMVEGMKFVAGSLKEVQGAEYGIVSQIDNAVVWKGDIPSGETISFEFKTIFTSLSGYKQCDNLDGDAEDNQCTNPVEVAKQQDPGHVLGTDDANVNTPTPRVLAYTGAASVNYIIVVGVVIAAITMATAVIAYVTRPRSHSGGGPTVTIVPSS